MIWPFSRKPKPLNPGPINEDWAYGDLAECLVGSTWPCGIGPETGDVCKVLSVAPGINTEGKPDWGLCFGGYERLYSATQFRKVPPLNSEATAEFTARIRACKPAKVSA